MSHGDHTPFQAFTRRILAAYSRRVSGADPEDLTELLALRQDLDDAIAGAVVGLRTQGFSWSAIARAAGITKQSAQERWGVRASLTNRGERA